VSHHSPAVFFAFSLKEQFRKSETDGVCKGEYHVLIMHVY